MALSSNACETFCASLLPHLVGLFRHVIQHLQRAEHKKTLRSILHLCCYFLDFIRTENSTHILYFRKLSRLLSSWRDMPISWYAVRVLTRNSFIQHCKVAKLRPENLRSHSSRDLPRSSLHIPIRLCTPSKEISLVIFSSLKLWPDHPHSAIAFRSRGIPHGSEIRTSELKS